MNSIQIAIFTQSRNSQLCVTVMVDCSQEKFFFFSTNREALNVFCSVVKHARSGSSTKEV